MPDTTRKPAPNAKEPAQIVLTRFLEEKGILVGTQPQEVEYTESGAAIIHKPKIIAVYAEDLKQQSKEAAN